MFQRPLALRHMDLFRSIRTLSMGGQGCGLVIIDDYSRHTSIFFHVHKSDSFKVFHVFCKRVQTEQDFCISGITSNHGIELENGEFQMLCESIGMHYDFCSLRTPQQIVERKNRTLQEMVKTMLYENSLPKHFWIEAINTSCYV